MGYGQDGARLRLRRARSDRRRRGRVGSTAEGSGGRCSVAVLCGESLVHPPGDDRGDDRGDRCGDPQRGLQAEEVGDDSADDCADGVAEVPPDAVDPDGTCTPGGVGDVSDDGEEGGVDIAVPRPRRIVPVAQTVRLLPAPMMTRAMAWRAMPPVTRCLRPMRSDRAPVNSCPMPHTPGYSANRIAICAVGRSRVANSRGNSPHEGPKFRLFTSPARLAEASAGSPMLARNQVRRCVRPASWLGRVVAGVSCAASAWACPWVSRTKMPVMMSARAV